MGQTDSILGQPTFNGPTSSSGLSASTLARRSRYLTSQPLWTKDFYTWVGIHLAQNASSSKQTAGSVLAKRSKLWPVGLRRGKTISWFGWTPSRPASLNMSHTAPNLANQLSRGPGGIFLEYVGLHTGHTASNLVQADCLLKRNRGRNFRKQAPGW
jgi:hypothetical protein